MFSHQNGTKFETDNKKISGQFTNTWKLNNILPSNFGSNSKSKVTSKDFELNENKVTVYQTLLDVTKAVH